METVDYEQYLDELKNRLHILHDEDNKNLTELMRMAHHNIIGWVGKFDIDNLTGRNLVFEYVRFVYNGQTEYFYPCFKSDLSRFSFELYQPPDDEVVEDG